MEDNFISSQGSFNKSLPVSRGQYKFKPKVAAIPDAILSPAITLENLFGILTIVVSCLFKT